MCASESATTGTAQRVTVDNFKRAETDTYFDRFVKEGGGVGMFQHAREPASIDHQAVIRMNRDTLYSNAVVDLDAGPATVTLPNAGERFMAMQVIDEDHYTPVVVYDAGRHTFSREQIGTRYVAFVVRTFADPSSAADLKTVHSLQDALKVEQAGAGSWGSPNWDPASLKKMRESLLAVAEANGGLDSARMFGRKDQVDVVQHLLGTAAGWGGNPRSDAYYEGEYVEQNDGGTVYRVVVKDVPVDGFWSVSVYNKDGFFEKNDLGAYSLNNVTSKRGADGSITIQFGGCNTEATNCLPITPGWNYLARMYRPRREILDGTWKFPKPQRVAP
ncbi:hypothetical protein GCM10011487_36930 [Steroidobacter agaridevorans]|uniref:Carboxylesterase n=1 Tax=Steroidobacter agaridevorans TaxID=2695856 RepID=A0A829YFK1_9GAMM|nr:hypothetical protein GCM10011487_36930 [Steroidobacter agaridevorans]